MLSSAKRSVPTPKQFVQPYFIQIAPTGAIVTVCDQFGALLSSKNIPNYIGDNVVDIFLRLGSLNPVTDRDLFDPNFSLAPLPATLDLTINSTDDTDNQPFIIRWIPSSAPSSEPVTGHKNAEKAGGWQLTGVRLLPDGPIPAGSPLSNGKKAYLLSSITENKNFKIIHQNPVHQKIFRRANRKRSETPSFPNREGMTDLLEGITDGFFIMDKTFRVELWNREAERITGFSSEEMVGQNFWEKAPKRLYTDTYLYFLKALKKKTTVTFEQYNEQRDRWLEKSIYPSTKGLFVHFRDITIRKKREFMLELEKKVLELNSNKNASLQTIVNYFLKGLEKIFPDMYGSVITLDEDGISVRHLSAPRLPAIYSHAIDGLPIGPGAGSCGTAMFRKEKVIVSDIHTDPLWDDAKELAMQFGLRACWSWPVLNAKGEVLASFAAYYKDPKEPGEMESELLDRASNLIRLIMENNQAEEAIKVNHDRYMLATKANNDAIWDWDLHTGLYFWGEGFYQQFGYKPGSKVRTRKFWEDHIHPDDRTRIIKDMARFIQQKEKGLWLEEYRFKRSDGKYVLISDRGFLVFGKERKLIRMIGSMQDITEKRETETRWLKQELNKQKLITRAMVDAQEKERAELGKELHDNVNQILSTTKLYLELAKSDDKERLDLIGRSAENIHEAIHEIRNISRSLVPSSIGDLGLQDSINDLLGNIRDTRAINVEFYPVGRFDEKIGDRLKLMLFRIIQEQVNNVLKHSAAKNLIVELTFEEEEGKIELNISDDGKGFHPERMKNKKGLGLSNITSRAELFGGKLTIVSAPGGGCKLRVEVPVL